MPQNSLILPVCLVRFLRSQETEKKDYAYMDVSLIRAVTISVEQKEIQATAKGSGRILKSKTLPNIADPEHATRHTAEALGAVVALLI
jgi:hypothetical protein